jgi:hypothetical protein
MSALPDRPKGTIKMVGKGWRQVLDKEAERIVEVAPLENGEMFLRFTNGQKVIKFGLSAEAADSLLMLLHRIRQDHPSKAVTTGGSPIP